MPNTQVYPSSSLFGFGRILESIAPGTVGMEWSVTNTPETGGDGILTTDPVGQVLHFSDNRAVGVYRRVMVDGRFGSPVLVTGLPLLNGFSLGWKDGVLHLLGSTWPAASTVHYQSTDWGQSFTLVETLPPPVLAVNRQSIPWNSFRIPVHYEDQGNIVAGVWSPESGVVGPIYGLDYGLVEPAIAQPTPGGPGLLIARVEGIGVEPFVQAWFNHQTTNSPAIPLLGVEPAQRVGGSPPCLISDGPDTYLGYAPTAGLGTGPPYWNIYRTLTGFDWSLFCRLDAYEANVLLDAHRYMTMIVVYDQDDKRWLLVCAGEPDNALRPAQEVKLNLDALQGVRLSGSGVAPLTCPPGDAQFDWWLHQDTATVERTYITVGSATQTLGGFMITEGGGVHTWPSAQYLNKDFVLGPRHWKGKRLTLRRGSGLLTWEINGLLVHSEVNNGVVPTQWAFTGPGGCVLTSVRISDG